MSSLVLISIGVPFVMGAMLLFSYLSEKMRTTKESKEFGKRAHKSNKPTVKTPPAYEEAFHPAEEKLHDQLKHLSNGGFGV